MKKKNENGTPKVLDRLIEILYEENGETPPAVAAARKPDLFRALCNLRAPKPVSEEFLRLQDEYLSLRTKERGVVSAEEILGDEETALWQEILRGWTRTGSSTPAIRLFWAVFNPFTIA